MVLLLNLVSELQMLNFGAHPDGAKLLNFGRLGKGWRSVGGSRIPASLGEVDEVRGSTCLSSNPCDHRLFKMRKGPYKHGVPCMLQGRERTVAHLAWLTP